MGSKRRKVNTGFCVLIFFLLVIPVVKGNLPPYWASDPTNPGLVFIYVNIDENSPTGTVIWAADAVDPEGTSIDYTQTWLLPAAAYSFVGFAANGDCEVTDSDGLDYEVVTGGAAGPHILIDIRATDQNLVTTAPLRNAWLLITIVDKAEAPKFSNLPNNVSLSEELTLGQDLITVSASDDDSGDSVTLSMSAVNPSGAPFAFNAGTGVISVNSNPGFDYATTEQYVITITASDGTLSNDANYTVYITPVYNPPTFDHLPTSQDVWENETVGNTVFTVSATDSDNDPLTFYLLTTGTPFELNQTTGVITLSSSLDYEVTTNYTLSVNVTDGIFMVGPETLIINVLDVNEMPTITSLPAEVVVLDSQTAQKVIHQVNVIDPEGATIVYSITTTVPAGAPFAIDTDGKITVNSNPGLDGTVTSQYVLTVSASDGLYLVADTLTVNITIVNDPPVISNLPDTITIVENTVGMTTVFTVSSTDPENDDVTYSMTSLQSPSPFVINSTSGAISHGALPNFDYETFPYYNLTITATDGENSSVSYLDVEITDVNEAPNITSSLDHVTVHENETAQRDLMTIAASDQDGDVISFSVIASYPTTASFSMDSSTGVLSVISNPGLDYESVTSYVVTVQTSDGSLTDAQNITIDVIDVNEVPSLDNLDSTVTVSEDETLTRVILTTLTSDPDAGDSLTIAIDNTAPSGAPFVCDSSSGNISLTANPSLDFETTPQYSLVVSVVDTGGLSATATLLVNVTDVNETPVITNLPNSTNIPEDTSGVISLYDVISYDQDGDVLTYSLTSAPAGAPFTLSVTGLIETTAAPDFDYESLTAYTLHVEVSDGALSYSADFVVNITDVNEVPVVHDVNPLEVALESETASRLVHSINASDEDFGDSLTYAIEYTLPGGAPFTCDPTSGDVTLNANPNMDFETTPQYLLNISVTDTGGLVTTFLLTLNVTDVNETPVITNLPNSTNIPEDTSGVTSLYDVTANDPDGDVLTYSLTSTPAGAPFTLSVSGLIETTAAPNFDYESITTYTLHVEVSDRVLSYSADFVVNITDVNEVPVVHDVNPLKVVLESETASRLVHSINASDVDYGDTLTYAIEYTIPGGAPFTCDPASGNVTLNAAPGLDFETTPQYLLNISVTDSGGLSTSLLLTINVTDVNEGQTITNLPANVSLPEDNPFGILSIYNTSASDEDGDSLSYTLTSFPSGAPFTVSASGEIKTTGSPNFDYETTSEYTLNVEVSDGALSTSSNLTVFITDVNEAPVFYNNTVEEIVLESETTARVLYTMSASDQDAGDTLVYSISSSTPASAPFSCVSSTGAISLASSPGLDFETVSQYVLIILVVDAGGLSDTATLTINVTDVNEQPQITNLPNVAGSVSFKENHTGVAYVYQVNATDVDGDSLLYSFTSTPSNAPFTVSATGEVSTVANPNFNYGIVTVYVLHMNVSDDYLDDVQDLTINIDDVNYDIIIYNLPDVMSVGELTTGVIFTTNATDPDGLTLTYSLNVIPVSGMALFSVDSAGDISIVSPPGLDYESITSYQIDGTATDTDGRYETARLDLGVTNEDEPPVISNLPDTVSVAENVTTGVTIFTVNATDPESDIITFSLASSPNDGKFTISGASGDVGYINNPAFEHESIPVYTLTIYATDGSNSSPGHILTVNIADINENPSISNLPAVVPLSEGTQNEAAIFQVLATDPDGGDNIAFSITVSPVSGSSKFYINNDTGEVYVVSNPGLDYETIDQYLIDVTVTDLSGTSTSGIISIDIQDENEAPTFNATAITVTIDEEQETASAVPVYITATDEDAGETLSYYLETPNVYNDNFAIALLPEPELRIAEILDYDDSGQAKSMMISVVVRDSAGLRDTVDIIVLLRNINDNAPVFSSSSFTATITENLPAGTNVLLTEATDADSGLYGSLQYSIFGVNGNEYFTIDSTGLITVKNSVDLESIDAIDFIVTAEDGGTPPLTSNVSVEIKITDENDNRPMFLQEFYNFQIRADANLSAFVGLIQADDKDKDEYSSPMNYKFVVDTSYFTLGLNTGIIQTKSGLGVDAKYVLYAVAQDNGIPQDTSTTEIVRVDTYTAADVLVDFTVDKAPSFFANGTISEFVAALQNAAQDQMPGAQVRLVYINGMQATEGGLVTGGVTALTGDTTVFTVVILKSNVTDMVDNLDKPKEYYTVSTVTDALAVGELSGTAFNAFPVTAAEPHIEQEEDDCKEFWLCTIPGNVTIAAICAAGLGCIAAGIYIAVKYCKKGKSFTPRRPPTHKRFDSRPKSVKNDRPRQSSFEDFDFRYNAQPANFMQMTRPFTTSPTPAPWIETDSPLSAPVYTTHGNNLTPEQTSLPDVDDSTSLGYHSNTPSAMSNRSDITQADVSVSFAATPDLAPPVFTQMPVKGK